MPARTYTVTNDLYAEVTDRIVAALEGGVAPWVCPWRRDADGGRPRNGASGHVYKGINVVLTGMAGFASSRWYTFNQAKQLGGKIRKGERGTKVVYWRFVEMNGGEDAGDVGDGEKSRKIPLLRHYVVFNAEQIDWPADSKHAPVVEEHLDFDDDFAQVRDLVDATGADVRHGGTRAFYAPVEDFIRVPDVGRFEHPGAYYATVTHELGHWTGHPSRLARDLSGRFGSESYAAEELVAELASAFLCADLGVAGRLQHAEYIGAWIALLRGDRKAVFTAARMAQEAADFVLSAAGRAEGDVGAQDAPCTLRAVA